MFDKNYGLIVITEKPNIKIEFFIRSDSKSQSSLAF